MSFPNLQPSSPIDIEVTLVLAQQASGKVTASALEFPNCQVEAETRETAISNLKSLLARRLQNVEMVPVRISVPNHSPNSELWSELSGVFKDSQYFDEVIEIIQAEREKLDDEEVDPSFYL